MLSNTNPILCVLYIFLISDGPEHHPLPSVQPHHRPYGILPEQRAEDGDGGRRFLLLAQQGRYWCVRYSLSGDYIAFRYTTQHQCYLALFYLIVQSEVGYSILELPLMYLFCSVHSCRPEHRSVSPVFAHHLYHRQ